MLGSRRSNRQSRRQNGPTNILPTIPHALFIRPQFAQVDSLSNATDASSIQPPAPTPAQSTAIAAAAAPTQTPVTSTPAQATSTASLASSSQTPNATQSNTGPAKPAPHGYALTPILLSVFVMLLLAYLAHSTRKKQHSSDHQPHSSSDNKPVTPLPKDLKASKHASLAEKADSYPRHPKEMDYPVDEDASSYYPYIPSKAVVKEDFELPFKQPYTPRPSSRAFPQATSNHFTPTINQALASIPRNYAQQIDSLSYGTSSSPPTYDIPRDPKLPSLVHSRQV